jgi:hypothetical protein
MAECFENEKVQTLVEDVWKARPKSFRVAFSLEISSFRDILYAFLPTIDILQRLLQGAVAMKLVPLALLT